MTILIKTIKRNQVKGLVRKISSKSKKKNPSAFFGKVKDGVDGLAYQKKLRDEWK